MKAQIKTAWIQDTTSVTKGMFTDDTVYHVRGKFATGEWVLYYDKDLTNKCAHLNYRGGFVDDTTWYRNGQLMHILINKDHIAKMCYDSRAWYADGSARRITSCNGDSLIITNYYHSGKVSQVSKSYKDSANNWMVLHYTAEYYENGQLKSDPSDFNGLRQNFKFYYENGKTSKEIIWTGEPTVGHCQEWYENDLLKAKGQYALPLFLRNIPPTKKIGTWSYYNESGKLIKEEFYEEGALVKTIEY